MAGILHYSTDPLVSRDVIGDPASCVFDSGLTQAAGSLAKVFGWYDNEWGYTCRLADLAAIVGERLCPPESRKKSCWTGPPAGSTLGGARMYRSLADDGIVRRLI